MASLIVARSVSIRGRRASVRLEGEFWNSLQEIAFDRDLTLAHAVAMIDARRGRESLPSAIRAFVIAHFRDRQLGRQCGLEMLPVLAGGHDRDPLRHFGSGHQNRKRVLH
jgi:predicted DNA-binding ribbon-helix-helix protein